MRNWVSRARYKPVTPILTNKIATYFYIPVGGGQRSIFTWRCEWRGHVRGVGVGFNDAVTWKCPSVRPLVVEMTRSYEQRAFAVETYFSKNESIVAVLITEFLLAMPTENPFRVMGEQLSCMWQCFAKGKSEGCVRTAENMDRGKR